MTSEDAGVLADRVANAARSVPQVLDLHGGPFGEVATYLPHRAVTGVRLGASVEVHVVASATSSLHSVADDVRRAVGPVVENQPVDVFIEDVR